jgi:hypothetical protein
MKYISVDTRSTGQGKTYSLIEYVIKEFLNNKTINWLVPNRSNQEDIFLDILSHPTFLHNIVNIEKKLDLPNKIIDLKDIDFNDFKVSLVSVFMDKLNIINSFYNITMLLNIKYKNKMIPKKNKKKYIKESDILIIDEVDRTLASLSLKEQIKNLYYLHLPENFNVNDYSSLEKYYPNHSQWLESFISNRLQQLGLDFNYNNEQLIKKLSKDIILKQHNKFKNDSKLTKDNFFKNYQFESETLLKKFLGDKSFDTRTMPLNDYIEYINTNESLAKPTMFIVENKVRESDDYKLYDSKDGQIIFFENIDKLIMNLVKSDGHIVVCSATSNNHVQSLVNECIKIDLPYDSTPFKKSIDFEISLYDKDNYKEIDKTLIIKESKSSAWNSRLSIKNIKTTKMTYLQDSNLVGSNDYNDYTTFVFDFKFFNVKQAPCDGRLSFYSKIGNGFLKTDDDIKKLTATYNAFDTEFKQQIKNKIIQSIGRLNRGNISKKYIYCKDDYIYAIVKDVIQNKLNQTLIER